jgi:hypothetical protein
MYVDNLNYTQMIREFGYFNVITDTDDKRRQVKSLVNSVIPNIDQCYDRAMAYSFDGENRLRMYNNITNGLMNSDGIKVISIEQLRSLLEKYFPNFGNDSTKVLTEFEVGKYYKLVNIKDYNDVEELMVWKDGKARKCIGIGISRSGGTYLFENIKGYWSYSYKQYFEEVGGYEILIKATPIAESVNFIFTFTNSNKIKRPKVIHLKTEI